MLIFANRRLQTYAYCSCYISNPADIQTCATNELKIQPNGGINTTAISTPWSISQSLPLASTIFPTSAASPLHLDNMQFDDDGPPSPASLLSTAAAAQTSIFSPAAVDPSVLHPTTLVGGAVAAGTPTFIIDSVKMVSSRSSSSSTGSTTVSSGEPIPTTRATRTEISTITSTGVTMITSCAATVTTCPPVYAYFTTTFLTTLFYPSDLLPSASSTPAVGSSSTLSTVYIPAAAAAATSVDASGARTSPGFGLNALNIPIATPVPVFPSVGAGALETLTIGSGGGDGEACGRKVKKRAMVVVW